MSWQQTEFLLKGIYLGLLLFVALQKPDWQQAGQVALFTLGGLVLFLAVSGYHKLRQGYTVRGRKLAFILFLLLDNPRLVYSGIILGLTVGAFYLRDLLESDPDGYLLAATVGGGAALGLVFWVMRHVQERRVRLGLSLALSAGLVAAFVFWYPDFASQMTLNQERGLAVLLLLGIPLFYLLTFVGLVEESEIEIGALCAALGLGLYLLGDALRSDGFKTMGLVIAVILYFLYTMRILPGLRVFKHVLRGWNYAHVGKYKLALQSLGRALRLDPANALARETLWKVHRALDMSEVVNDPETLELINFDLCLQRVRDLLMETPKPEQLAEANRLLDLVSSQRPIMQPRCAYWRAVALLHQRCYEEAAALLESVLDDSTGADNPHRRLILFQAWQLCLIVHPEMNLRVGTAQLRIPGRRMEAIAAVERRLAEGEDPDAWDLKRLLYSGLTEEEYNAARQKAAADFDYEYSRQLGLALVPDAERWQRGVEYLRIAARGLPAQGPSIYVQVAKAHERAGDIDGAWQGYELAMRAGRAAGPKQLAPEDRHSYFAVVKMLADHAMSQGNHDAAIEAYHYYTEYERSGVETYRALAELYERKGEVWPALRETERGLIYNSSDKDLLARKDRYYYSVMPEDLRARLETEGKAFDVEYCLRKASTLVDKHGSDLDLLDWAQHLAELAQVARPASPAAKVLQAQIRLRRGERPEAVALLEEVRSNKPEKFSSSEEEDAWYLSCKLLGTMYLDEKPELAVECLQAFKSSAKSGADTLFKLGVAYEHLGDLPRAKRCYEVVTAFESHPLARDAQEALRRLQVPQG
jgi:tetratricopeptide (TPR) repeat protein